MMTKEYEQLVAELKNGVIRELAEECGKSEKEAKGITRSIRLPSGETSMKFVCDGNTVRIIMTMEGVSNKNMQVDDAAFEGWALALHVHLNKNIRLELDTGGETVPDWDYEKLHYNRFLYRLKKFDDIYGWFSVEEKLSKVMQDFDHYLFGSGAAFRNNIAEGPAGISRYESRMEATFAANAGHLRAYSTGLFRQLPVGLYDKNKKNEKNKKRKSTYSPAENPALTCGDLTRTHPETDLVIYELKTLKRPASRDKSGKVGIISELMFYANYTYDVYVERNSFAPAPLPAGDKDHRGYERLAKANITSIRAYMLTDKLHPLITPKVLEEMNRGSVRYHNALTYDALKYEWEEKDGEIVLKGVGSWF